MQLEELQQQWQRLDQKLDRSLALESELLRQALIQPARRRLKLATIWPALDLMLCVVGLLLFGSFLGDHWRDWRLAVPAVVVMISFAVLLGARVWQLVQVAELDWCGPVLEIQRSLGKLRVAKIRQFKWIMLLSPLLGFCMLVIGLQWLFAQVSGDRVNILDKLDPWWVAGNYVLGVLFVPLGYLVARVLAERYHSQRWWQAVLDDISGKSLKAATRDVERWASLQQDASS